MTFNGNEGEQITLETATKWAANWRNSKAAAEMDAFFFGRESLMRILDQPDCLGIRIYFAVNDEGVKCLILIGTDAQGNDIVTGVIMDKGIACPPHCGVGNGLNGHG